MEWAQILVIILSVFMALFLLLAIVLVVKLIQISRQIRRITSSGKTFEMVAFAMESKRLGMCSKSLEPGVSRRDGRRRLGAHRDLVRRAQ